MDVAALREQIPALKTCTYLNTGGIGPSPAVVLNTIIHLTERVRDDGPNDMAFHRESFTKVEETRGKIARLIGADPDEVALGRSTAEGFNAVGHGLTWREGDEVIFGAGDHPAARAIWAILARRHGIRPVRLDLRDDSPEAIVDDVRRLITPRTRLISLSHVTSENGLRVPARAIADLAHAHGAKLILDGCQAVGQFPIDVATLGCDFYAAGCYKWLLAPYGTGFFWIRKDLIPDVEPSWVGAGGTVSFDPESASWESLPNAQKFEFGARYYPLCPAQGAAVDFVSRVGLDAIQARSRTLVDRMLDRLAGRPGVVDFTPRCADLRTGMVGVAVQGMTGSELAERLHCRDIQLRANTGPGDITGVRLCLAFFVTEAEVDATADAIVEIAAGGV